MINSVLSKDLNVLQVFIKSLYLARTYAEGYVYPYFKSCCEKWRKAKVLSDL